MTTWTAFGVFAGPGMENMVGPLLFKVVALFFKTRIPHVPMHCSRVVSVEVLSNG